MATRQEQLNSIAEQLKAIKSKIATEGITDSSGKTLLAPTITADALSRNNTTVKLPNKIDNTSELVNAQNIGNASVLASNPKTTEDTTGVKSLFEQYTDASNQLNSEKASSVDLQEQAGKMSGYGPGTEKRLATEQAKLDALNAQLTGLTNAGTAEQSSATSRTVGQGTTTSQLSSETSAIARQNAIQALRLQASIQAQQAIVNNNTNLLNNAKETMNTYYSLLSQDAENEYNYKKELLNSVYDYATSQEQAQLEAKAEEEDRLYTESKSNLSDAQNWASTAISNGQSDIAQQIMKLDSSSDTFQNDLADLVGQIKEKEKTTKVETTPEDIKSSIDQTLLDNNAFGSDGKISWETYAWMNANWINNGGTQAGFAVNYPITQYLDENNQMEYRSNLNQ